MARRACDDLLTRFWDEGHGGLFWSIDANGRPLDTRKHLYGQVFGIYALSEYHRLTGDAQALERAIAIYRLMEEHARDRTHGGYFEELDRAWRRRTEIKPRQRLMGGPGSKSQNAHLHLMEAYTSLLRAWPDPGLRDDLRALTELMLTRVLNPANHHLHLFLDDDWAPRSEEISYGHDIEFSWLVCETADVLGDGDLQRRARVEALAIADACWREGVDADGGMFNEGGPAGVLDPNKDWWPQAEAAVGFLNAWELSQERRYLDAARRTWEFIDRCLVDHQQGEWYRSADRAGRPDLRSPPISLWKCPYHNGRACLETVARIHHRIYQVEAAENQ
jgi:mannobiose 2-epimerase